MRARVRIMTVMSKIYIIDGGFYEPVPSFVEAPEDFRDWWNTVMQPWMDEKSGYPCGWELLGVTESIEWFSDDSSWARKSVVEFLAGLPAGRVEEQRPRYRLEP
jgi:hypothetical protein